MKKMTLLSIPLSMILAHGTIFSEDIKRTYFTDGTQTVIALQKRYDTLKQRTNFESFDYGHKIQLKDFKNSMILHPKDMPPTHVSLAGYYLKSGDQLETKDNSRCTLEINDSLMLTLGEKTAVNFHYSKKTLTINVTKGNVQIKSIKELADLNIQVETSDIIIPVIKNNFVISYSNTKGTSVINSGITIIGISQFDYTKSIECPSDNLTHINQKDSSSSKTRNSHYEIIKEELNWVYQKTSKKTFQSFYANHLLPVKLDQKIKASFKKNKELPTSFHEEVKKSIFKDEDSPVTKDEQKIIASLLIESLKKPFKENQKMMKQKKQVEMTKKEAEFKKIQDQMIEKANKLKALELEYLKQAEEAERKANQNK